MNAVSDGALPLRTMTGIDNNTLDLAEGTGFLFRKLFLPGACPVTPSSIPLALVRVMEAVLLADGCAAQPAESPRDYH
ncbi:MAG: hypothetical protein WC586_10810 [Methanoregula sp.]